MALVFAMVLTGLIVLMPTASAAGTTNNAITDAPAAGELGTIYQYTPTITSSNEWAMLHNSMTAGAITIGGASWLTYNLDTRVFSGTPTATGTFNIQVSVLVPFSGEIINSWTVVVVEAIPFAFTSSIGIQDVDYPDEYYLDLLIGHEDVVTYEPTTNYPASIIVSYPATLPSWLVWDDGVLSISGAPSAGGLYIEFEANRSSDSEDVLYQYLTINNQPFNWVYEDIIAGPSDIFRVDSLMYINTPITGNGIATIVNGPDWLIGETTYPTMASVVPGAAGTHNITVKGTSSINSNWTIWGNFTVTVWNPASFLSVTPSMTLTVGQNWVYTPAAYNPEAVIGYYDMPSWISYNSTTKTFSGTPITTGTDTLVIFARTVASVGVIDEATQQVILTVVDSDESTIAPVADFALRAQQSAMTISFYDRSSDATAYLWDFGDGTTSTVARPYHTYATAGLYNVTLAVANAAGSDSKTVQVNVGMETIPPAVVTKGQLYSFTPSDVGTWMSLIDNETNVNVEGCPWLIYNAVTKTFSGTSAIVGSYNVTVTLIATNEYDGNTTITWTIQVMEALPIANFGLNAASGIAPFTVYFLDSSVNAQTYSWAFGDGEISTLRQSPHVYWNAGYYEVSLTVTNSAGSDTKTELIHVAPAATTVYHDGAAPGTGTVDVLYQYAPNVNASGEWGMLYNSMTAAQMIINGASWLSYNNVTKTFFGTPENAGHYDVRISIYVPFYGEKVNGWTIVVSAAAVEPEPEDPTGLVPLAAFVCSKISGVGPLNVTFIDYSVRATSWSWNFGDGTGSLERDVVHVFTEAGTYNVTLTVSNEHGNDTYVRTITVTAPVVDEPEDEDDETPGITGIDLLDKLLTNNVGMALGGLGLLCLGGAAFIRRPLPAIVGILLLIAVYLLLEGWWVI